MKQRIFTLMMMLALVIVTGSAFAQTSITPFQGATYSYTVSGIDASSSSARTARIYYTTNAAPGIPIALGGASSITVSASSPTGTTTGNYHNMTLADGTTTITFDLTYGASVPTSQLRIWIEVIQGTCSNLKYLLVTPVTNTLDYSILASVASTCTSTTTPTSEGSDAVNATTTLTYTVNRIDGTPGYDWSFALALNDDQSLTESVVVTTGTGTVTGTSPYRVSGSNTVTVTVTVTNVAGTNNATYAGLISSMQQFVGTTAVVNSTADLVPGNNSANTILLEVPAIGTFSGN
jgi:hypothetical protein